MGDVIKVCGVIITAVEKGLIHEITPELLTNLSKAIPKKKCRKKRIPIITSHTDREIIEASAKIRGDLATENWKMKAIQGIAWLEPTKRGDEIVSLIYNNSSKVKIFLHREIIEHPSNASILIQAIRKKYENLISTKNMK